LFSILLTPSDVSSCSWPLIKPTVEGSYIENKLGQVISVELSCKINRKLMGVLFNWFLMTPSIATKFSIRQLAFIFLLSHYMFRPLRTILRWDIQLDVSMDCPLMQRIRCTCATRCRDVTCCTSAPWLCIPNTCYHMDTNIKVVDTKL
jgi:hypothetical protein